MGTQQCPFCGLVSDIKAVVCAACGLPFVHEGVEIRRGPSPSLPGPAQPWVRPAASDVPSAAGAAEAAESSALYDTLAARVRQYNELRGPLLRSEPGPDQPTIVADPPAPARRRPRITIDRSRLDRTSVIVIALIVGLLVTAIAANVVMNRSTPLSIEDEWLEARGEWVTHTDDRGGYRIDLPVTPEIGPDVATPEHRTAAISAERLRVRLEARHRDLFTVPTEGALGQQVLDRSPADVAKEVNGTVRSSFRTSFASLPAVEFLVDTGDQRVLHGTAVMSGKRLYVLSVTATVDPAVAFQRFASSFEPIV